MAQEDKFKREIDRIGLVLAKLLDLMLGTKRFDSDEIAHFVQQCDTALNIDLEAFLHMPPETAMDYLLQKKFTTENLRLLGHLLYDLAVKTDDEHHRLRLLNRALYLYRYVLANNQGTLYLDVMQRIKSME